MVKPIANTHIHIVSSMRAPLLHRTTLPNTTDDAECHWSSLLPIPRRLFVIHLFIYYYFVVLFFFFLPIVAINFYMPPITPKRLLIYSMGLAGGIKSAAASHGVTETRIWGISGAFLSTTVRRGGEETEYNIKTIYTPVCTSESTQVI